MPLRYYILALVFGFTLGVILTAAVWLAMPV